MPDTNVSGLASGIDWANIVSQLMEIERQPILRIQNKQSEFEQKLKLWQDINSQLTSLRSAADTLRNEESWAKFSSTLTSSSSSVDAEDILSASTTDEAAPGNYDIIVNQVARKEKLSSQSFSDNQTALNLSGDLLVNGQLVSISTTDTLRNIRDKINAVNSGDHASEVTATILESGENDFRLIVSSDENGADGFNLLSADNGTLLQDLGLADTTTQLRHTTSDGARSNAFSSANVSIASLLGLTNAQSATVQIGGENVTIDLAADSLVDIANTIDGTAGLSASVISEENASGEMEYRLDVSGSTQFTDSNNILETLGFLEHNHSNIAEIHGSDIANVQVSDGMAISETTTFGNIDTGSGANNVTNGDTISISGTDHNGNAVSSTFTIDDTSARTVGDFLTEIENTFGNVDAYISDGTDGFTAGTLVMEDLEAGESQLSLSVTANNEGGGTLDFGTMTASTEGRSMQLQAGQDSRIQVDGVNITKSGNTIADVIEGVTLNLNSADPGTTITLGINRDTEAIKKDVNTFITAYNKIMGTIGEQFSYSEEEGTGGILFGDGTLRSVQASIRNPIVEPVADVNANYSTLAMVGIHLDNESNLSMDEGEFLTELQTNFYDVKKLFVGTGTSANSQIQYVTHSRDTENGIYDVNITQAATKGQVTGTVDLSGGIGSQQTLQVTSDGGTADFTFDAGTDIDSIVAAISSEFDTDYTQTLLEATGHNEIGGSPITANTTLDQIDTTGTGANDISDGDSIGITGTTRNGTVVSTSFTITDRTTQTVGDLLSEIENTFNGSVTASVDSNGQIQVVDNISGKSQLSMTLTYTGSGSLAFDTMDETVTGRYSMDLSASKTANGELQITNNSYGSSEFTVTADAGLGLADGTYAGQDVAGTINGESATGKGQTLTGDDGNLTTDGLVIDYTGTATGDVGDITLSYGAGELMYQELYNVVDIYDGYVSQKIDSLNDSIRRFDGDIEQKEYQVELKRQSLMKQFMAMESTIGGLNAQSSWLQSQLNGLMVGYL